MLSRILEEGLASDIYQAMDVPLDLALEIMSMRAYARVKETVESARSENEIPDSPMVQRVFDTIAEIVQERRTNG